MEPATHPTSAAADAGHARFAALVEPHLPALRAYVERRDPSLADDVMSELGVVAWRRLDDLPDGHERAWLFGVARTVLLAERRKAATRSASELGDDAFATLATSGDDAGLASSVEAPLGRSLATLAARDRELLLLTAWEGLSTAEAAGVVGIRPTAARMALVRARRRLAAALDEADPGWRGTPSGPSRLRPRTPQEVPTCADAER